MRKHLIAALSTLAMSQAAFAEPQFIQSIPNLPGAESIVYDEAKQVYFVSLQAGGEPGDGSIVALNEDFKFIATVARGLENPKGIAIKGERLFVGDMENLVEVNLTNGNIIKHRAENAEFLNDVAIDDAGDVYVSDMFTSAIYKYSNNQISSWMESPKLENPNGLKFIDGQLYVSAWGYFNDGNPLKAPKGRVLRIDPKSQSITPITQQPLGNLDGLQIDNRGDLIVSDWKRGTIYSVSTNGQSSMLIDLPRGAGDVYYSQSTYRLFVPMALEGEILVFRNISL